MAQSPHFVSRNGDTYIDKSITSSPDGQYIYVGGSSVIAVFKRQADGTLHTTQVLNNDHLGMSNLWRVNDLIVTPDGKYLYAVNGYEELIVIFSRDAATGKIEPIDVFHDPSIFVWALNDYNFLLAPNSRFLYWSYSDTDDSTSHVIAVLERNQESGALKKTQVLRKGDAELHGFTIPGSITLSPDGKHLYGAGKNHSLLSFSIDQETGHLTFLEAYDTDLMWWHKSSILVSPDGRSVYTTDFDDRKLLEFNRDPENGKLAFHREREQTGVVSLRMSPQGDYLYVGRSSIVVFQRDLQTHHLTKHQVIVSTYSWPAGWVVTPDGRNIYGVKARSLSALAVDSETGMLSKIQQIDDGNVGGTDRLNGTRSVAVSPNGKRLYSVAQNEDSGITVFRRDKSNGRLTQVTSFEIDDTGAMAMSPDGKHFYIQAKNEDRILKVFSYDSQTGNLDSIETRNDSHANRFLRKYILTFSHNGLNLYAGERVYSRNANSGCLTALQLIDTTGLHIGGLQASAVSADGRHFYWNGDNVDGEHFIATFRRNLASGELAFHDKIELGVIDYTGSIAVAPDGKHVLVGSQIIHGEHLQAALTILSRDSLSGEVTFIKEIDLPDDLWQTLDIVFSKDGLEVYVLIGGFASGAGILAMYIRDPETGELTLREYFKTLQAGVFGLGSPRIMTLSPDDQFIYIADGASITTFATGRSTTTAVQNPQLPFNIPRTLTLEQNYPNPFNPVTTIKYELPRETHVSLNIYDMLGRKIRTLVNKRIKAGYHSQTWDGLDDRGKAVASGIYFYRLKTIGFTKVRKMTLLE